MYFALDPHDISALVAALRTAFFTQDAIANKATQKFYYALVDGAFDHGHQPLKWSAESVCIYSAHERLAALSNVSPSFVVLSSPGSPEFETEVRRLSRHCNGRPMLSFLQSEVSAEALCEQWQKCLMLPTQDGSTPYVLRLADTRILPALATLPSKTAWTWLTRHVRQWLVVGRTGALQALNCPAPVQPEVSKDDKPASDVDALVITNQDLAHLLSQSQPDSVINAMHENFPDLLPHRERARFYDHVAQACSMAELHGIDAFADVMALAMASHFTQGQILHNAQVTKLLESHNWPSGQLSDALSEHIPDEVL